MAVLTKVGSDDDNSQMDFDKMFREYSARHRDIVASAASAMRVQISKTTWAIRDGLRLR